MGARLVSHALQPQWAILSPTTRLILIAICQTARDQPAEEQPARTYWAGHGTLAIQIWGEDTEGRRRVVRRAIGDLTRLGAIEPLTPARGRSQAAYHVTPDNAPAQPS